MLYDFDVVTVGRATSSPTLMPYTYTPLLAMFPYEEGNIAQKGMR